MNTEFLSLVLCLNFHAYMVFVRVAEQAPRLVCSEDLKDSMRE